MLSDRALRRMSLGLRHVAENEGAGELDPPTEVGASLGNEVLAGRFRLLGPLAAGGMGVVHRALDLQTGHEVAVKIPNLGSASVDRRFQIECDALTAVVAPSVVRVLETGTTEVPFLAMELVRGDTLGRWIRDHGAMPCSVGLAVVRRVAAALAVVHAAGWIHRDVKPGNITITDEGDVRLVDFGLARAVDGPGCGTATGQLVGTLSYIAPEQLTGARIVDARVDVFALGCVLYECLTGRAAFRRLTSEVAEGLWAVERHPELDPEAHGIDGAVGALIRRFASPSPDRRPIDGLAALAELCALEDATAPALAAAGGATAPVRGAALGALRGPVVLTGSPGSGRSRAASCAAMLLTEMLAPCRALAVRGHPRSSRIPGSHALALVEPLRAAGFRNAARALAGIAPASATEIEPSLVLVVLDANLCDAASLDRIATAAQAGLLRVVATARTDRDLPAVFAASPLALQPGGASPLGAFERWVLRAGAMFGTVFEEEGVAALIDGPERMRVPEVLERLAGRGVLRRTGDGRFAITRSADWYGALGALSPRDVRLGVSLVEAFERGATSPTPEVFWLRGAVDPPLHAEPEGGAPIAAGA